MTNANKAEYKLVFEAENVPFLFMDIHMQPVPWHGLVLYNHGHFAQYTKRSVINEVGEKGVKKLSDPDYSKRVVFEARRYLEAFEKTSNAAIKKSKLTKSDVENFIDLAVSFIGQYAKTDHLITEVAAGLTNPDQVIANNLNYIARHKNALREGMNQHFFETGAIYGKFLAILARQQSVAAADIHWLSANELVDLCEDANIPVEAIKARKHSYVIINHGDRQEYLQGEEAAIFCKKIITENTPTVTDGVITGTVAHKGSGYLSGTAFVMSSDYGDIAALSSLMHQMKLGMILVSQTTAPEMMPALKKAAAVITDIGGLLSHAAITARELGIPCIVDTQIASKKIQMGDLIEIDADNGVVKIIK